MKKYALCAALMIAAFSPVAADARGGGRSGGRASTGVHWTTGHTTRTGTYVQGHYSTNPNGTRNDNFSTRGNTNPYTGKPGTKPRDGEN